MNSDEKKSAAIRKMIDQAAEAFERSGHLPDLQVRRHLGNDDYAVSISPNDCEDGMRETVKRTKPEKE